MNNLLIFFALPVATIILAIAVEKILRNPLLTAAVFFAIYLIVSFAFFDETFLVFTIIYTIIAFIAAVLTEIFFSRCKIRNKCGILGDNDNNCHNHNNSNNENISNNQEGCGSNNCSNETVTANITNNTTGRRSTWYCCRR